MVEWLESGPSKRCVFRPWHFSTPDTVWCDSACCCALQYAGFFLDFYLIDEKTLVNFENHQVDNREGKNEESF